MPGMPSIMPSFDKVGGHARRGFAAARASGAPPAALARGGVRWPLVHAAGNVEQQRRHHTAATQRGRGAGRIVTRHVVAWRQVARNASVLVRSHWSLNFESLQRKSNLRCQSAASTMRRWPSAHCATA